MKSLKTLSCLIALSLMLAVPVCADEGYIKYIDFTVTKAALNDCSKADIESYKTDCHISWIELLSALGVKYGGNFKLYKKSDADAMIEAVKGGADFARIANNDKLYNYYLAAYGAVLSGFLGEYTHFVLSDDKTVTESTGYGLTAYSPIAAGYYYSHFDDFGASRSYGYRRPHLGHDLMGCVGTPVIAVEGGYVEACGWNQYGGWRLGIRSFDGLRYYYYAHLRRNHPYCEMYEGKQVCAGEVIGYLGMTGYSSRENTNNIDTPHLHYGLQIIFDPSQKDGYNQIWVDMYALTEFLYQNRAAVIKTDDEAISKSYIWGKNYPD